MRYQSLPSSYSEIKQETTRERAARQCLERRAELTFSASDEQRWRQNREHVIAKQRQENHEACERDFDMVQKRKDILKVDADNTMEVGVKNTKQLPDESVRSMLQSVNQDILFATVTEAFEVLQSWGWKDSKDKWVEVTQSDGGQIMVNYGLNGKDVVTTSMIIAKLGDFGMKATVYTNHKGTELIKFTGYAGIRKILNAPVFGLNNPKVVDVGIGKYGLKNSIVSGARLTFYVAAAYRTVDFILNDETSLADFIGSLATDVAKIGISSAISWGAGAALGTVSSFVVLNLVVVVGVGLFAAWGLNALDAKFGVTDQVVAYIESAQQEVVKKAKEMEEGVWDLGAMFVDGLLEAGREVVEEEIKRYVRKTIRDITPRCL